MSEQKMEETHCITYQKKYGVCSLGKIKKHYLPPSPSLFTSKLKRPSSSISQACKIIEMSK